MNPSEPAAPPRGGPLVFFTAVGLAVPAALGSTLPATLRVSEGLSSDVYVWLVRVWPALAAGAFGPMLCSILILRGAREGFRAFGGSSSRWRTPALALGFCVLFVALSLFGGALRATTHHRALAGVTFALGGLAIMVMVGLLTRRVVVLLEQTSPARLVFGLGLTLAVCGALFSQGSRFISVAHDSASSAVAGMVVDVLAFALAAIFSARPAFAGKKAVVLTCVPLAVAVAASGIFALRDPVLRTTIEERAPAFAPLVDLVPST